MTKTALAVAALSIQVGLFDSCGAGTPLPEAPPLEEEQAPGSVEGRFAEINIGKFDLVDGIAWRSERRGTVVYVTSKPIASSMLATSACPATMARALTAVRDAGWLEVTLDASGKSNYFGSGTPYAGSMRALDPQGDYVSSTLTAAGNRVSGKAAHKDYGGFRFDLPLLAPEAKEVSEDDRMQGVQAHPSAPAPSPQALTDAYRLAHAAAVKKDWDSLIGAVGFDTAQVTAIRSLPNIDADLQAFADRFLTPGAAGEIESRDGHGFVQGEGTNAKGARFINYYWFAPCQSRLVLYSITENPQ